MKLQALLNGRTPEMNVKSETKTTSKSEEGSKMKNKSEGGSTIKALPNKPTLSALDGDELSRNTLTVPPVGNRSAMNLGRMKPSKAISTSNNISPGIGATQQRILKPTAFDVLFGRGKPYQGHSGNIRFHRVVDFHKARYLKSRRDEKFAIAEEIVRFIKTGGVEPGRFLKRFDGQEVWMEVNDSVAREKVSHALRSKPRKGETSSSSSQAATTTSTTTTTATTAMKTMTAQQSLLANSKNNTESGESSIRKRSSLDSHRAAIQHSLADLIPPSKRQKMAGLQTISPSTLRNQLSASSFPSVGLHPFLRAPSAVTALQNSILRPAGLPSIAALASLGHSSIPDASQLLVERQLALQTQSHAQSRSEVLARLIQRSVRSERPFLSGEQSLFR